MKILGSGAFLFTSYLTVAGDERFYTNQLMPLLQRMVEAETAHVMAVKLLSLGVSPQNWYEDPATLVRTRTRSPCRYEPQPTPFGPKP